MQPLRGRMLVQGGDATFPCRKNVAVLVVANHPNALLDPLIIFRIAGRVVRPLAKEPLFRQAFLELNL